MSHRARLASAFVAALLLALSLSPPAAAQFGKNKIQYKKFDWKIYHSPHFDVYYYEAEAPLLQRVVSFAESAYDELSRRFDYQIETSTTLIFYRTHAEFEQNNIQLGFVPEAVGAFATDVRFRMVLPVDLPDAELHGLMLHELTHIFQYHIIFGGKVSRGLTTQAPTWLIEGMASYYGRDESTSDKMFLRDAVVNDQVPPITRASGGGFFAYRFGHAVFDYMAERWGDQGVLDFLYEYRSSLAGNVDRALKRAFRIEAEDFDADFRRWLRQKYLPELVKTGEPSYFGRRFFGEEGGGEQYFATAVSPSGDLVASLGTAKGKLDVVLFDTRERRPMRNLTKGWSTDYQHLTAQFATASRRMGSDLSFSPDGNTIAVFAKRESGRSLLLVDVIHGGVRQVIDVKAQQPFSPSWSPDGRTIVFSGSQGTQFDLFLLDVETGEVKSLTDDARFDGGAVFTPDGKSVVFSSEVGAFHKLFRVDLADPGKRYQLTRGDWSDVDPTFTRDGKTIFFTSDRTGFDNIYSLELLTGQIRQHTNAVTACFMPAVVERADDSRALVYAGYWRSRFDLYRGDLDEVPEVLETLADLTSTTPTPVVALQSYEPDIQVTIDPANIEEKRGFKLFMEDGGIGVGVGSDQVILSDTTLIFSDYLGDRRVFLNLQSVESYTDFVATYMDLSRRKQWGVSIFDQHAYFLTLDNSGALDRESAFRQTGVRGFMQYPFDFYHRAEASLGAIRREYDFVSFSQDINGNPIQVITPTTDTYPEITLGYIGDSSVYAPWGPISGRRYRIEGSYAPRVEGEGSSTVTSSVELDARQYIKVTERSNIALRAYGYAAWGDVPDVTYFGGLDTVRGFDYNAFNGDRGFFTNIEYRFPLVDALYLPFLRFQSIRGRIFLDVGGAWYDYAGQSFVFWDSEEHRLEDARSAYGWGFTINFVGMEMHWDFAKVWDFKDAEGGFESTFWIGSRF